jgi:hypothetical protein
MGPSGQEVKEDLGKDEKKGGQSVTYSKNERRTSQSQLWPAVSDAVQEEEYLVMALFPSWCGEVLQMKSRESLDCTSTVIRNRKQARSFKFSRSIKKIKRSKLILITFYLTQYIQDL